LLYERGGFVDEILVHKLADDYCFLCVNASNQERDASHSAAHIALREIIRSHAFAAMVSLLPTLSELRQIFIGSARRDGAGVEVRVDRRALSIKS